MAIGRSGRSVKPRRTVTTPTYTKQSFREFKKLNVPPRAGRALTSFKRRS